MFIGFRYEYISSLEVIKNMIHLRNYGTIDISILIIGILLTGFFIFFIVPYINFFIISMKKEKEKKKKELLMNKIILQKDLEDIIAKELASQNS